MTSGVTTHHTRRDVFQAMDREPMRLQQIIKKSGVPDRRCARLLTELIDAGFVYMPIKRHYQKGQRNERI